MPRTRTGRTSTTSRRRINAGSSTSTRITTRRPTVSVPPYTRDTRWATPDIPRNDVFVVDIGDRYPSGQLEDDTQLLTA